MDTVRYQAETRTLFGSKNSTSRERNYLGIILDENLSLSDHLELICNKVSKRLGLLSRIRPYLTLKASKCVYNCLVQAVFNYTDTEWGGLSLGCNNSLQRLQIRAANIIQRRATTDGSFKMLGWVDLETQRKVHKCILVFKLNASSN